MAADERRIYVRADTTAAERPPIIARRPRSNSLSGRVRLAMLVVPTAVLPLCLGNQPDARCQYHTVAPQFAGMPHR
jgi:hypothetical protein